MEDEGRSHVRLLLEGTEAVGKLGVATALAALGAAVVVGREVVRLASSLFQTDADAPAPHHHEGRVRARAMEAEKAARAAGLLSKREH